MFFRRPILFTFVAFSALVSVPAQTREKWQRVYTGEESVIEINVPSLSLEPKHILRAEFRTILAKPENLVGAAGAQYKSRLETIEFKLNESRYRLCETTLLDSRGVKLQSYTAPATDDWRVLKHGGVMERLFTAARALPPFGSWKAVAYRLADGSPNTPEPILEKLVGTRVRLHTDRAEVGMKVCESIAYENKRVTQVELLRKLGVRLESFSVNADYAETTNVRCEGGGWAPPTSLLVKVNESEMLMLWQGVFLVLKREREGSGKILPSLKRSP